MKAPLNESFTSLQALKNNPKLRDFLRTCIVVAIPLKFIEKKKIISTLHTWKMIANENSFGQLRMDESSCPMTTTKNYVHAQI